MHKVVGANAYIGPLFRKNFSEGGPTWASAPTFLFAIMKIPIVNLFCNSSILSKADKNIAACLRFNLWFQYSARNM